MKLGSIQFNAVHQTHAELHREQKLNSPLDVNAADTARAAARQDAARAYLRPETDTIVSFLDHL